MLLGTARVIDLSLASISSTEENQRLKLSALICGLSAADSRCHNCAHFLSIAELLTLLHNRHTGRFCGKSPPDRATPRKRATRRAPRGTPQQNVINAYIRGKTGCPLGRRSCGGSHL